MVRRRRFPLLSLFSLCLLSLLALSPAAAAGRPSVYSFLEQNFPDNSDLRSHYSTRLITGAKEKVWEFGGVEASSARAGKVLIKTVKRESDFLVEFINEVPGNPSAIGPGSYVIRRENKKGYILGAKIFLSADPDCYVWLYPAGNHTGLDVVMYGVPVRKALTVSILIYQVLPLPFSQIAAITSKDFNWGRIFSTEGAVPPDAASLELENLSPDSYHSPEELNEALEAAGFSAPAELSAKTAAGTWSAGADPLVPSAAKAIPAYGPAGLPSAAASAGIFLAETESHHEAYLLSSAEASFIVLPERDSLGLLSFRCHGPDGAADWSAVAGAGKSFRIFSIDRK